MDRRRHHGGDMHAERALAFDLGTEACGEVVPVARVESVQAPSDLHQPRIRKESGDALLFLRQRTRVLVPQAEIQRKTAGNSPIILNK